MNTVELNQVLSSEIQKLRSGKAKIASTKAIVQCSSQIIAAARLELSYARLVGTRGVLPFFGRVKTLPAPKKRNGK